jgi:beta-phosphoglucomutase-like phosphatase (HAD superfamily)
LVTSPGNQTISENQIGQHSAIIFDFDGTLVDTMPLHFEAYRQTFAEMHLTLTSADFYENIGGAAREAIPKFLRGRKAPWPIENIHHRKKQVFANLLQTDPVRPLPASELLPVLFNRVPIALASSGSRPGITTILTALSWNTFFAAIVTGEETEHGKPAPDLFLLAASRLNVEPRHCLVFEYTDDGVAAARNAGMKVIDVRSMTSPQGSA